MIDCKWTLEGGVCMSGYTIEDIDIIRKKSGISYQEAVALLEYHNGNLAQALIDLERNGKLKKDDVRETKRKAGKNGIMNIVHMLYSMRICIRHDDSNIINFSVLFCLICLFFAPWLSLGGCVLALILGYHFSFTRHDSSFDHEDLEEAFHHAADNVKSSLGDVAKGFTGFSQNQDNPAGEKNTDSSYYQTKNKTYRSAPSEKSVPRRVDSQDGQVHFTQDGDGYSSATIE